MLFKLLATACALSGLTSAFPTSIAKRDVTLSLDGTANPIANDDGEYVRVNPLSDGSLIAGYTAHEDGFSILRTAKSTDNGTTWTSLGEVYRRNTSTSFLDNAFPIQIQSGRVLFAYRNHDTTPGADGNPGALLYTRISVSASDDGGATWQFLSNVDERTYEGVNGVWEPFLRIAKDGCIQAYYSAENSAADQDSYMRQSNDGGVTWSDYILVSGGGIISRDGMTGVTDITGNGNLICVFETNEFFPQWLGLTVGSVTSDDDGQTWGNRSYVYRAQGGNSAGAPQVINVGGTLVSSFVTNETTPAGAYGIDGGDFKVVTSSDGGNSWSSSFLVGPASASWPGLYTLDNSHFLALYNQAGPLSQEVALS